jgi:hypothetical protein
MVMRAAKCECPLENSFRRDAWALSQADSEERAEGKRHKNHDGEPDWIRQHGPVEAGEGQEDCADDEAVGWVAGGGRGES